MFKKRVRSEPGTSAGGTEARESKSAKSSARNSTVRQAAPAAKPMVKGAPATPKALPPGFKIPEPRTASAPERPRTPESRTASTAEKPEIKAATPRLPQGKLPQGKLPEPKVPEAKASPPAESPKAPETKPAQIREPREASAPAAAGAQEARILSQMEKRMAEMEDRMARAVELFEKRLTTLAAEAELAATQKAAPGVARAAGVEEREAAAGEVEDVTAAFRRAMSEAIDHKIEELIAPIAGLYHRLKDEEKTLRSDPRGMKHSDVEALIEETASELEKILRLIGGGFITPQVGEYYDPLIHLAVGEAQAQGGTVGVVAQVLRPGYKSGRGRVVLPARVLVGGRSAHGTARN